MRVCFLYLGGSLIIVLALPLGGKPMDALDRERRADMREAQARYIDEVLCCDAECAEVLSHLSEKFSRKRRNLRKGFIVFHCASWYFIVFALYLLVSSRLRPTP